MTPEVLNVAGAIIAAASSVTAVLINKLATAARKDPDVIAAANSAQESSSGDPLQPALDRLSDARVALERQSTVAKINRWTSGTLTFGQYVIGGVLASSFVQQSLSREIVGTLGVLVLVSSLVYQHFRPDIQLRGSLGRAHRLRALIRRAEDDLYAMRSQASNAPSVDDFRRSISDALSEIESSELQDLAIRKDVEAKEQLRIR
jgi:hypothetical protein